MYHVTCHICGHSSVSDKSIVEARDQNASHYFMEHDDD